jgi:PKHD-type hydroxylase
LVFPGKPPAKKLQPMIHDSASAATAPYVAWKNAFSGWEVDQIVALCDRQALEKAKIAMGTDVVRPNIRISHTARVPRDAQSEFLYAKVGQLAHMVNEKVYQFDLTGFAEAFQYTIYEGSEGGYYDWHIDHGGMVQVIRKLSFSLQLSDPSEYEGGDLELYTSPQIAKAPRERGTLIAFPSYALHRVAPVTSGRRRSLVIWTQGPRFR